MAELVTLARPYANAAFAVARQDARLAEWSRVLQLLAALTQAEEVQHLLNSPDQSAADKVAMLVRLCGEEADDKVERLLQELARNKRLTLLPAISEQFEVLRATAEAVLDVEVSLPTS
jgi:F-type H+-transporting ATPase subunit delta